MKKVLWVFVMVTIVYVMGYIVFRQSHLQYWPADKKIYVIFPASPPVLYYLWRPMSYLDGRLTGMQFHKGPHR